MVTGRGVQFTSPRGYGIQFSTAVTDAVTAASVTTDVAADVTADDAATAAAQRAERRLPRCRDRGVGIAAGRAARPVAGAGHRPSVFFRRHHRDAVRAHRRPIRRVRQLACAICTIRCGCGRVDYRHVVLRDLRGTECVVRHDEDDRGNEITVTETRQKKCKILALYSRRVHGSTDVKKSRYVVNGIYVRPAKSNSRYGSDEMAK